MGGLYNMVIGDGHEHERGQILIALLGGVDPGRFRDAWIERGEDGDPVIAIYTRNGGGNREEYKPEIEAMRANALYLRDADDTFDSTYATFYFAAPPEHRDALRGLAVDPVDTDEVWRLAIAALDAVSRDGKGPSTLG